MERRNFGRSLGIGAAAFAAAGCLPFRRRTNKTPHIVFVLVDDIGYGDPGFHNPRIEGHQSAGPFRGYKSHIWEGGHRIPFIARWPGRIEAGSVSDEPICLTDMMATLSAITGAEMTTEAGPDSYDISPALLGKKRERPLRDDFVFHFANGTFAVRQGEWKRILDNQTSGGWVPHPGKPPIPGTPGQLYNLNRDPYEQNDLWDRHPEIVGRLTALLDRFKRELRSVPVRR